MRFTERIADFVTGGGYTRSREAAAQASIGQDHFREAYEDASAALDQAGWELVGGHLRGGLTNSALKGIRKLAWLMWQRNPLIRRGVEVQANYVFGQGMEMHAENAAANEVLQQFWNDEGNKEAFTDIQSLHAREQELKLYSEIFIALPTDRLRGAVKIRVIDADEIEDIICNPDDACERWYYKRVWSQENFDIATGRKTVETKTAYYPDKNYNPSRKPKEIGGHPVEWDCPIRLMKTGSLKNMVRGISEIWCAIDWATAYKNFLEDRATVARSLSRWAWSIITKLGKKGVNAARTKIASTIPNTAANGDARETNPAPAAGSVFIGSEEVSAAPMKAGGATINPDEGRRFLLMVCSAFGLPETFFGDVSVGTLATATSLDRPTELMMTFRRALWTCLFIDLALYVLLVNIRAPLGKLKGEVTYAGATPTILIDKKPAVIHVKFPPLIEHNTKDRVLAIDVAAAHVPDPETICREMLSALGVKDIDTIIEKMTFPTPAEIAAAAAQAAAAKKKEPTDAK